MTKKTRLQTSQDHHLFQKPFLFRVCIDGCTFLRKTGLNRNSAEPPLFMRVNCCRKIYINWGVAPIHKGVSRKDKISCDSDEESKIEEKENLTETTR
ncbi:hypothetical protein Leryth_001916 [Lithospermum erythrorhizon]|nr:hypothetical protein Leryth_001916 [Lithospermum erythrorhizon]